MAQILQNLDLYACLPFVSLAKQTTIQLGPVLFWPASRYKEFVVAESQESFNAYIHSIGQIKASVYNEKSTLVNTMKVFPEEVTCISLDRSVQGGKMENLLIDSLYLLYFACTFRNLYFGDEIPSFTAFRKMIPASHPFVDVPENWQSLFIKENYREEAVCIHILDAEICEGFGHLLSQIYTSREPIAHENLESFERIIRSIRYLVDRLYPRFVNVVEKGLSFTDQLFKPEDLVFLGASFEALLDIHGENLAPDFKHKLRPMLQFKYGKPVELFWKWVDDFLEVRNKVIRGGSDPDINFRANPTFVIPHTLIGMKLYIYAVYCVLHSYNFLSQKSVEESLRITPVEELHLFFWTEESLLKKIERSLEQIGEEKNNAELQEEIFNLACIYITMCEKKYLSKGVIFIPSNSLALQKSKEKIQGLIVGVNDVRLPPEFVFYLKKEERL